MGLENSEEWVLRVPEVVVDAGVNFAVSHFELDTVSNLPVGVSLDAAAGSSAAAESALCLPIAGTPTEAGSYEVIVSGTMYIVLFGTQFPIPNYAFAKTVLVEVPENPIQVVRMIGPVISILLRQAMTVHANGWRLHI